ncbi:hypothetical protein M422DRAFT_257607 [Sphaerobolus stellatus SS14]|uniref:Nephrocystin 3-like N-terminal domain-containing protein n=1 Tax=Sphaerobolus stellatus (strain SS14) TaxID=990650 RepID=A0A0C9VP17_SPHS4|nr:hypothetical protein M422DRAFT_257607 [Sphaerobolus stellatus SS14]
MSRSKRFLPFSISYSQSLSSNPTVVPANSPVQPGSPTGMRQRIKRFLRFSPSSTPQSPSNPAVVPANSPAPNVSENVPEWVEWTPNKSTLIQLKNWKDNYPPTKLFITLEKYVYGPFNSPAVQALLDSIPDSSVPITGLVKALVNVLHLAIKFPLEKQELYNFVKDVIEEITRYAGTGGHVTQNRQVTSQIRDRALEEEKQTLDSIEKTFKNRVAQGVQYDDRKRPSCYGDTRGNILATLEPWAKESSEQQCYWITGPPDSGKSTLAATFARLLKKQNLGWAWMKKSRESYSEDLSQEDLLKLEEKQLQDLIKQMKTVSLSDPHYTDLILTFLFSKV